MFQTLINSGLNVVKSEDSLNFHYICLDVNKINGKIIIR